MDTSLEAVITDKLGGRCGPRRKYSIAEKRAMVEETHQRGASVPEVAQRHDVNANLLSVWRRLYRGGLLKDEEPGTSAALLPVKVATPTLLPTERASVPKHAKKDAAYIEVAFAGGSRLRIHTAIDRQPRADFAMIELPAGVKVWLAAGATDMRKGVDGLAALVQTQLAEDAFSGQLFVFRGRAGDRVKILWWSGDGLCLFAKRLERGRFVWPHATHGAVSLSSAQLSMLLESIDWRRVERSFEPQLAV